MGSSVLKYIAALVPAVCCFGMPVSVVAQEPVRAVPVHSEVHVDDSAGAGEGIQESCSVRFVSGRDTVEVFPATSFAESFGGRKVRMASVVLSTAGDPLNPVDTLLEPSARWFDFTLAGVSDTYVLFRFRNTDPVHPVYSHDGKEWVRFDARSRVVSTEDGCTFHENMQLFSHDTVRVAYFMPYSYDRLAGCIGRWSGSPYVSMSVAGLSHEGRPMHVLRITDPSTDDTVKKTVYIHGRTHTGETPSAWYLESLTDTLAMSGSEMADALRRNVVFHIIPSTNPDGVAGGLSRSNACGINLEINYDRPDALTAPEVKVVKGYLDSLLDETDIDLALNMHSQIGEFATFWVHDAASTSESYFAELMRFACLLADATPYMDPSELCYSAVAPRYVEGWLWNRVGERTPALTFETPYTVFGMSGKAVDVKTLSGLAVQTLEAIADYLAVPSDGTVYADLSDVPLWKRKLVFRTGGFLPGAEYEVWGWTRFNPEKPDAMVWERLGVWKADRRGRLKARIPNRYSSVKVVEINVPESGISHGAAVTVSE